VVSTSGDVARYNYTRSATVTSITRETAPAAGIIDINHAAPAPAYGHDPRARIRCHHEREHLSFNGVQATVRSAAADRLQVTVPAGATTGLWWSTLGGDLTSLQAVRPCRHRHRRSAVTPTIGPPGTKVTVNGTGFQRRRGPTRSAWAAAGPLLESSRRHAGHGRASHQRIGQGHIATRTAPRRAPRLS